MENGTLKALCARKKAQLLRLREVSELTRQIAEAAERRDEIAVEMLLGERDMPLRAAYEIKMQIREELEKLPAADALRIDALLRGAAPESEEESELAGYAAQYRRLIGTVVETDKRLSLRIGGKNSFYEKFGT